MKENKKENKSASILALEVFLTLQVQEQILEGNKCDKKTQQQKSLYDQAIQYS